MNETLKELTSGFYGDQHAGCIFPKLFQLPTSIFRKSIWYAKGYVRLLLIQICHFRC